MTLLCWYGMNFFQDPANGRWMFKLPSPGFITNFAANFLNESYSNNQEKILISFDWNIPAQ